MLNVKYIITEKQVNLEGFSLVNKSEKSIVYKNENALPRVYFVNSVETETGLNLLDKIKNSGSDRPV